MSLEHIIIKMLDKILKLPWEVIYMSDEEKDKKLDETKIEKHALRPDALIDRLEVSPTEEQGDDSIQSEQDDSGVQEEKK